MATKYDTKQEGGVSFVDPTAVAKSNSVGNTSASYSSYTGRPQTQTPSSRMANYVNSAFDPTGNRTNKTDWATTNKYLTEATGYRDKAKTDKDRNYWSNMVEGLRMLGWSDNMARREQRTAEIGNLDSQIASYQKTIDNLGKQYENAQRSGAMPRDPLEAADYLSPDEIRKQMDRFGLQQQMLKSNRDAMQAEMDSWEQNTSPELDELVDRLKNEKGLKGEEREAVQQRADQLNLMMGYEPRFYTGKDTAKSLWTNAYSSFLGGISGTASMASYGIDYGSGLGNVDQNALNALAYVTDPSQMNDAYLKQAEDVVSQYSREWNENGGNGTFFQDEAEKLLEVAEYFGDKSEVARMRGTGGRSGLGKFVMNAGYTISEVLADSATGNPAVSMFVRTMGNEFANARKSGVDITNAAQYGIIKGAIEAATEKVFGEGTSPLGYGDGLINVEEVIRNLATTNAGQTLLRTILQTANEGIEEALSDMLAPAADMLIKDETWREAWQENTSGMLYDFLLGGALGLLGAVGGVVRGNNAAANAENNAKTIQEIETKMYNFENGLGPMPTQFELDALRNAKAGGVDVVGAERREARNAAQQVAKQNKTEQKAGKADADRARFEARANEGGAKSPLAGAVGVDAEGRLVEAENKLNDAARIAAEAEYDGNERHGGRQLGEEEEYQRTLRSRNLHQAKGKTEAKTEGESAENKNEPGKTRDIKPGREGLHDAGTFKTEPYPSGIEIEGTGGTLTVKNGRVYVNGKAVPKSDPAIRAIVNKYRSAKAKAARGEQLPPAEKLTAAEAAAVKAYQQENLSPVTDEELNAITQTEEEAKAAKAQPEAPKPKPAPAKPEPKKAPERPKPKTTAKNKAKTNQALEREAGGYGERHQGTAASRAEAEARAKRAEGRSEPAGSTAALNLDDLESMTPVEKEAYEAKVKKALNGITTEEEFAELTSSDIRRRAVAKALGLDESADIDAIRGAWINSKNKPAAKQGNPTKTPEKKRGRPKKEKAPETPAPAPAPAEAPAPAAKVATVVPVKEVPAKMYGQVAKQLNNITTDDSFDAFNNPQITMRRNALANMLGVDVNADAETFRNAWHTWMENGRPIPTGTESAPTEQAEPTEAGNRLRTEIEQANSPEEIRKLIVRPENMGAWTEIYHAVTGKYFDWMKGDTGEASQEVFDILHPNGTQPQEGTESNPTESEASTPPESSIEAAGEEIASEGESVPEDTGESVKLEETEVEQEAEEVAAAAVEKEVAEEAEAETEEEQPAPAEEPQQKKTKPESQKQKTARLQALELNLAQRLQSREATFEEISNVINQLIEEGRKLPGQKSGIKGVLQELGYDVNSKTSYPQILSKIEAVMRKDEIAAMNKPINDAIKAMRRFNEPKIVARLFKEYKNNAGNEDVPGFLQEYLSTLGIGEVSTLGKAYEAYSEFYEDLPETREGRIVYKAELANPDNWLPKLYGELVGSYARQLQSEYNEEKHTLAEQRAAEEEAYKEARVYAEKVIKQGYADIYDEDIDVQEALLSAVQSGTIGSETKPDTANLTLTEEDNEHLYERGLQSGQLQVEGEDQVGQGQASASDESDTAGWNGDNGRRLRRGQGDQAEHHVSLSNSQKGLFGFLSQFSKVILRNRVAGDTRAAYTVRGKGSDGVTFDPEALQNGMTAEHEYTHHWADVVQEETGTRPDFRQILSDAGIDGRLVQDLVDQEGRVAGVKYMPNSIMSAGVKSSDVNWREFCAGRSAVAGTVKASDVFAVDDTSSVVAIVNISADQVSFSFREMPNVGGGRIYLLPANRGVANSILDEFHEEAVANIIGHRYDINKSFANIYARANADPNAVREKVLVAYKETLGDAVPENFFEGLSEYAAAADADFAPAPATQRTATLPASLTGEARPNAMGEEISDEDWMPEFAEDDRRATNRNKLGEGHTPEAVQSRIDKPTHEKISNAQFEKMAVDRYNKEGFEKEYTRLLERGPDALTPDEVLEIAHMLSLSTQEVVDRATYGKDYVGNNTFAKHDYEQLMEENTKLWELLSTAQTRASRQLSVRSMLPDYLRVMKRASDILIGKSLNNVSESRRKLYQIVREHCNYIESIDPNSKDAAKRMAEEVLEISYVRGVYRVLGTAGKAAQEFESKMVNHILENDPNAFETLKLMALGNANNIATDFGSVKLFDALAQLRYINMLSNPKTGVSNLLNNLLHIVSSATAQNVGRALTSRTFEGMVPESAMANSYATKLFGEKADERRTAMTVAGAQSALSLLYGLDSEYSVIGNNRLDTDSSARISPNANPAMMFLNRMSLISSLRMETTDAMQKAGTLTGMLQGIEELNVSEEHKQFLREEAKAEADIELFHNDSKVAEALNKFRRAGDDLFQFHLPGDYKGQKYGSIGLGTVMLPFVKVPTNVVMRAVEASPIGSLYGLAKYAAGVREAQYRHNNVGKVDENGDLLLDRNGEPFKEMSQREIIKLQRTLGKSVTNLGITALGFAAAAVGALKNVDRDKDKDLQRVAKEAGLTGLQLNVSALLEGRKEWKADDVFIGGSWLQILSVPLSAGAMIHQAYSSLGDDTMTNIQTMAAAPFYSILDVIDAFQNLPGIDQLKDIWNAYENVSKYNNLSAGASKLAAAGVQHAANDFASFFVPNSLAQLSAGIDNTQRDVYTADTVWQQAANIIINKTPFRGKLPEKLDSFGNPRRYGANTAMSMLNKSILPGNVVVYKKNDVIEEAERLSSLGYTNVLPKASAPSNFTVDGEEFELTASEQREFYRNYTIDLYHKMSTAINSDQYKALDDIDKQKVLRALRAEVDRECEQAFLDSKNISDVAVEFDKWETNEDINTDELEVQFLAAKYKALSMWDKGEKQILDYSGMDEFLANDYKALNNSMRELLDNSFGQLDAMYKARTKGGIDSKHWQAAYDIYYRYNNGDDRKANAKNTTAMWAEMQKATGYAENSKQMRYLRDNMQLTFIGTPNMTNYEELIYDYGFSSKNAATIADSFDKLTETENYSTVQYSQKWNAIADTNLTDAEKYDAFFAMVPSNYTKQIKNMKAKQLNGTPFRTAIAECGINTVYAKDANGKKYRIN